MPKNAPEKPGKGPQSPGQADPGTEPPSPDRGARNGAQSGYLSKDPEQDIDGSFSREYVERLREESKANRLAAQRADFLATEVRRLATREATRGILTDPESLTWSADFEGEDGLPDHDRLRAAATDLAKSQPWLARPRGDVGQGQHSDNPAAVSLSELLRA